MHKTKVTHTTVGRMNREAAMANGGRGMSVPDAQGLKL